jgi:hypothetical protein
MAAELAPDHRMVGHPVELQRTALTDMGAMTVKRSLAAPKGQHRPGERRHLRRIIIKIARTAQQPQPALGMIPHWVHVEQQGDDLARRIGMDAAVIAVASAAHCQQGRPIGQIDAELLLDRAAQLGTPQRGDEVRETAPIFQTLNRIAAVTADLRKIGEKRRQHIAPQKLLYDDEIERVVDERRCMQAIEIEDAQPSLQFCDPGEY